MERRQVKCNDQAKSLDSVGRVIDFSDIKARLAMWVEDNWDHHFLIWHDDPDAASLVNIDPTVVLVPFNPTAENMAEHLVKVVAPQQLAGTGIPDLIYLAPKSDADWLVFPWENKRQAEEECRAYHLSRQ